MARLPIPGADDDQWGVILNEFLLEAHHADGQLILLKLAANLTELRAVTNLAGLVYVADHTQRGDGGGGLFFFDEEADAEDDDGLIIQPLSAPAIGRWVRRRPNRGVVAVTWFGAIGDGEHNDLAAIRNAIKACPVGGTVRFPRPAHAEGFYRVYEPDDAQPLLKIVKSINLVGVGALAKVLGTNNDTVHIRSTDDAGIVQLRQPILDVAGTEGAPITVEIGNLHLSGGTHGVKWGWVTRHSKIENVGTNYVTEAGIELTGGTIGAVFRRLHVTGNSTPKVGISISDSTWGHTTRWLDCRVTGTQEAALRIVNPENVAAHQYTFMNFVTEGNKGAAYDISGAVQLHSHQPHFEGNGQTSAGADVTVAGRDGGLLQLFLYGGNFSTLSSAQTVAANGLPFKRIEYVGSNTVVNLYGTRIGGLIEGNNYDQGSALHAISAPTVNVNNLTRVRQWPDPFENTFHDEMIMDETETVKEIGDYVVSACTTALIEIQITGRGFAIDEAEKMTDCSSDFTIYKYTLAVERNPNVRILNGPAADVSVSSDPGIFVEIETENPGRIFFYANKPVGKIMHWVIDGQIYSANKATYAQYQAERPA